MRYLNTFSFLVAFPILINGYGQEVTIRRTSNTCRKHSDCPTYAYCEYITSGSENGQCVCQEGYTIVAENRTRECLKVAQHLGDPCTYDEQCMLKLSTEAECNRDICQCRYGTHYVQKENACYKSVAIGDYCRLTNNCIGENTVCRSGICHCPIDTHPSHDRTVCLDNIKLGDRCHVDEECITNDSRCHDVCRCKTSHVISNDAQRCLHISNQIYSECEEDLQCQARIGYTVCGINNTCVCRDDYHEVNYQCWVSVYLGGICESDNNCIVTFGAICTNGKCECEEGFTQIKGQCSGCIRTNYMHFSIILICLLNYLLRHV